MMDLITHTSVVQFSGCVGTIGFFDGVHRGHRFLLEQVKAVAREEGLESAVVTFPIHPRKVLHAAFQPELLSTAEEKLSLLTTTGVDHCILLPFTQQLAQLSAYDFMKFLRDRFCIRALVIGYDHRFGHNRSDCFDDYCRYGKELGIRIVSGKEFILHERAVSSSAIRQMLKTGQIEQANDFLGYAYFLDGTVIEGHHVGRTLGFPTANLKVDDADKLLPMDGVYAVYVYIKGQRYIGMLNIGNRPTLDNGSDRSIETHILHFSGDLYRQPVHIEWIKYLRGEQRYNSIEDLVEQMKKDRDTVSLLLKN